MNRKNLFIVLIILVNTSISFGQIEDLQKVTIVPDSCFKWNLPAISVTVEIPSGYDINYNTEGGFYFQANKIVNSQLVEQISFGRMTGDYNEANLVDALAQADHEIRTEFDKINQSYLTQFIGIDKFANAENMAQLRSIVVFKDFSPIIEGKFHNALLPIILSPNNKFMLSAIAREDQDLNDKNISLDFIKIVKSIE